MRTPRHPRCPHCSEYMVTRDGALVCPEPSCGWEYDEDGEDAPWCDADKDIYMADEERARRKDEGSFERAADCVSGYGGKN